jgi:hypothetical protein
MTLVRKSLLIGFGAFLLLLVYEGCRDTSSTADNAASVVIGSEDRAKLVKLRTDLQTINRMIEVFHAEQGRYPDSLKELAEKGELSRIPRESFGGRWEYDSAFGRVTSSTHPNLGDLN